MRTLSDRTAARARALWAQARPMYGPLAGPIDERLGALEGDMAALMALAYGTLPLGDGAGQAFDTLAAFARHGLYLRRNSPFCRELDEEMFLHFVWYPRVNDEALSDHREAFWRALRGRIAGLDATAAALEVNRWCAEHMTYRLTDERTMSPLTAWRTGSGRCGEESAFCVAALRSVGIAARQVYVPWWAHCDDNHAWVEFWDGGGWRFMGACEPEPAADRGWFCAAAARAPVVRYRTFFDYGADRPAGRIGPARLYNVTARYAPVREVTVRVTDDAGQPVAGALVTLCAANMGAYRPVLWGRTDAGGVMGASVGRGALHVEAALDGRMAEGTVPAGDGPAALTLTWGDVTGLRQADLAPAPPYIRERAALSPEERAERRAVRARCEAMRLAREESWARSEYASAEPPWGDYLRRATGNGPEIWRFYQAHTGPERAMAAGMLGAMGEKDLRDATFGLLEDHLRRALPGAGAERFAEAVLCPRIGLEPPEDWRRAVEDVVPPEALRAMADEPERAAEYAARAVAPAGERVYPPAEMGPSAALACGHGDGRARSSLTVALLRCAGVPARLDPADGRAEYWREGAWHGLTGPARTGTLTIAPAEPGPWVCGRDWTLSRREGERWLPLSLPALTGPVDIPAAPGLWRLMTCRRLADGTQLVRTETVELAPGQRRCLTLTRREDRPETLICIPLPPVPLADPSGGPLDARKLLPQGGMLLWLRPGEEPTEHVLGALARAAGRGEVLPPLGLVLEGPDREAAVRTCLAGAPLAVAYDTTGAGEDLARELFLEPGELPMTAVLDRQGRVRYAAGGYRAGGTDLAMALWRGLDGGTG